MEDTSWFAWLPLHPNLHHIVNNDAFSSNTSFYRLKYSLLASSIQFSSLNFCVVLSEIKHGWVLFQSLEIPKNPDK